MLRSRILPQVMIGVAMLVAGCAAPVAVTPVADAPRECLQLRRQLPLEVSGQRIRRTSPTSPSTDAWGDPAIVLRCGVPQPASYRPDSELVGVDGVDWYLEPIASGYRFTTFDRVTNVEVSVPSAYAPEVNPLVDLAPAIKATVPQVVL